MTHVWGGICQKKSLIFIFGKSTFVEEWIRWLETSMTASEHGTGWWVTLLPVAYSPFKLPLSFLGSHPQPAYFQFVHWRIRRSGSILRRQNGFMSLAPLVNLLSPWSLKVATIVGLFRASSPELILSVVVGWGRFNWYTSLLLKRGWVDVHRRHATSARPKIFCYCPYRDEAFILLPRPPSGRHLSPLPFSTSLLLPQVDKMERAMLLSPGLPGLPNELRGLPVILVGNKGPYSVLIFVLNPYWFVPGAITISKQNKAVSTLVLWCKGSKWILKTNKMS